MQKFLPLLTLVIGLALGAGGTYFVTLRTPRSQQGEFTTVGNDEGRVNFPVPYLNPPNVTVEPQQYAAIRESTVITSVDERGFHWKMNKSLATRTQGKLFWYAKGI